MPEEVRTLTRVDCLNDYVAILMVPSKVNIHLPEGKYKSEGMVVGAGPDVGQAVSVGDFVMVRDNKYTMLNPDSGPYEGLTVIMVHKPDLITRLPKRDDNPFVVEG